MSIRPVRRVTLYFLYAEVLDIITTTIGLSLGMREINPIANLGMREFIIFKLILTLFIGLILQFKKPYEIDIVIPIVAIIPTTWNCLQIVLNW